ncbi:hypothetical protein KIN20_002949 [Parelaphostrongylus tenuis]|uniref:Uncharacterized protein n=1 Tax=Parelaphostrongylus tenuis TaxID=148309 RepID=A0AAD5MP71_PARTN|nr:hypothetical protein KIN20_002949 [Parelaphostrongylus tenuis]
MSQATPLLLSFFVLLQFGACSAQYESPFNCNGAALHDFLRDILLVSINTIRARVARGHYERNGRSPSNDMNKLR